MVYDSYTRERFPSLIPSSISQRRIFIWYLDLTWLFWDTFLRIKPNATSIRSISTPVQIMTRPSDLGTFVVSLMPRHLFRFINPALDLVVYAGVLRMSLYNIVFIICFTTMFPVRPEGKRSQMGDDHVPAVWRLDKELGIRWVVILHRIKRKMYRCQPKSPSESSMWRTQRYTEMSLERSRGYICDKNIMKITPDWGVWYAWNDHSQNGIYQMASANPLFFCVFVSRSLGCKFANLAW